MSTQLHSAASIPGKVSLSENWNLNYWTVAFRCSVSELNTAVAKVGTSSLALTQYFSKKQTETAKHS